MNILVTGAGGFIGSALVNSLGKVHEVYGVVRFCNSAEVNIFELDLTNNEAVRGFLECEHFGLEFDVILHLASVMANLHNADDIGILGKNATILRNSILLANHFKVKHFINFSSSSVYPNVDGVFDEMSNVDPSPNSDCIYGLSKWNSEVLLNLFSRSSSMKVTHLRCGMVFGENMNQSRIYPIIRNELLSSSQATLFGGGERVINYIFIEDLIRYVEVFVTRTITGVYNIITISETLLDFARRVAAREGIIDPKINLVSKGNAYKFVLDNRKLKKVVGEFCGSR
ncbi:MAG: NAD-dependent epimerase/dehydratase family protein [Candidatus Methylumidiphilus sp.]